VRLKSAPPRSFLLPYTLSLGSFKSTPVRVGPLRCWPGLLGPCHTSTPSPRTPLCAFLSRLTSAPASELAQMRWNPFTSSPKPDPRGPLRDPEPESEPEPAAASPPPRAPSSPLRTPSNPFRPPRTAMSLIGDFRADGASHTRASYNPCIYCFNAMCTQFSQENLGRPKPCAFPAPRYNRDGKNRPGCHQCSCCSHRSGGCHQVGASESDSNRC
jgi:hypothetical protein